MSVASTAPRRRFPILNLSLFALVVLAVALVAPGGPLVAGSGFALRLAVWLGAGGAWLALVLRARKRPPRIAWLVAGALVLRVVAFAGDPGLSDDHYRYAWEGGLIGAGVSPYAHAPEAPELAEFRERWPATYDALNNRDVSAAYPPTTQAAVAGVVALAGGPEHSGVWLRAAFALADLFVLLPLALLARRPAGRDGPGEKGETRGSSATGVALVAWGWSPLVALEFAGAGHFDSLGLLLLLAALVLLERHTPRPVRMDARELVGWWTLAAAALTKFLPLAAVPFLLRGSGALRRAAWFGLGLALAFTPLVLLEGGASGLTRGLGEYALRWESTNLVYDTLESWLEGLGERDGGTLDPRRLGRLAAVLLLAALAAALWLRRAAPTVATGALIGAFLVLTPTLHPWYLVWIVPFVGLRPRLSWLALLALAPLLYWPLAGWAERGVWESPAWIGGLLAGVFFSLRAWEFWSERQGATVTRPPAP